MGEIGRGQRLGFVGEEQADVAGFGLRPAQPQSQPDPVDFVGILSAGRTVAGPPPAEPPFSRSRMPSRACEIGGPPRPSISARTRAIAQFGRFSTGSDRDAAATASARTPPPTERPEREAGREGKRGA